MSAGIDGVTSELQEVYRGVLKRFVRRIVFVKPDYVIVYDELVPSRRASFDWLLHLPDVSRVTMEGATALYSGVPHRSRFASYLRTLDVTCERRASSLYHLQSDLRQRLFPHSPRS